MADTSYLEEGSFISSRLNTYIVEQLLGKGTYGRVVKCHKIETDEKVAMKAMSMDRSWIAKREVDILKRMKQLDPDKSNLVKFFEAFQYKRHICLAFEMLEADLDCLMSRRRFKPLCLSGIREITHEILVALDALHDLGVTHCDLKPNNIMLVSCERPFRIKVIDFGMAVTASTMWQGRVIQVVPYRAPEVVLGLPLNNAIDIWALGCILAFLYLGDDLYPLQCEYALMKVFIKLYGQPNNDMLKSGFRTERFFTESNSSWRFYTRFEYMKIANSYPVYRNSASDKFESLDDLACTRSDISEHQDILAFIDLLKQMFCMDPSKRITSRDALLHHFCTRKHTDIKKCHNEKLILIDLEEVEDPFSPDDGTPDMKEKAGSSGEDEYRSYDSNKTSNDSDRVCFFMTCSSNEGNTPPGKSEESPPACTGNPGKDETSHDTDMSWCVEVKTRKTICKRISKFFSSAFSSIKGKTLPGNMEESSSASSDMSLSVEVKTQRTFFQRLKRKFGFH